MVKHFVCGSQRWWANTLAANALLCVHTPMYQALFLQQAVPKVFSAQHWVGVHFFPTTVYLESRLYFGSYRLLDFQCWQAVHQVDWALGAPPTPRYVRLLHVRTWCNSLQQLHALHAALA